MYVERKPTALSLALKDGTGTNNLGQNRSFLLSIYHGTEQHFHSLEQQRASH